MKLSKMYPRTYAAAEDITQPFVVTIRAVVQDEVYSPWEKRHVKKWALCFQETPRKIIMGRKLAFEIAKVLGSDDTDDWISQQITLYSEPITVAGKQRRTIRARKPEDANSKTLGDEPPAEQEPTDGKAGGTMYDTDPVTAFWVNVYRRGLDREVGQELLTRAGGDGKAALELLSAMS